MSGGSDPRRFAVSDGSPLRLLWIVAPLLLFLGLTFYPSRQPAEAGTMPFAVTLTPPYFTLHGSAAWSLAIATLITVLLCWLFFRRRVQLDGSVLSVHSTFYRKHTPVEQMDLQQAAVVDLKQDRRHGLRHKINAYGMPGFHSGHYRLHGGGKGFALVTDVHRVLVIPVRDGPTLLLSLAEPQSLLDALRRAAMPPGRPR